MLELDFEALSGLGLTPALASRAMTLQEDILDLQCPYLARISEVHRETLIVHDSRGERSARPLPRLVRDLIEASDALAVGDWVVAFEDAFAQCWVAARVPPVTHIVRRDGDGRRHPVVSNVDVALLVMGLDDDFNPRRLERYLALVQDDGILPVVVLTKIDVPGDEPLEKRLAELRRRIPPRVDVVAVNATDAWPRMRCATISSRDERS